ncbi:MAG: hypothetical protein R3F55_13310 [Alphaproteobacteria bacterium]
MASYSDYGSRRDGARIRSSADLERIQRRMREDGIALEERGGAGKALLLSGLIAALATYIALAEDASGASALLKAVGTLFS